jgi:YedE family putative selenium metabolism protein
MAAVKNILATRWGIIGVGVFIGLFAALLQKCGNPANMGICVACFDRDIAGAIGLHRAALVQYMRPEIIGFVLGSLLAAYLFKEFRPRAGSAPIVRFMLGVFAMIGALVFLGCPWRALLRLAGGDGNAIFGLAGLIFGIWIGTLFLKAGYNLGRSNATYASVGWLLPLVMLGFLVLMFVFPQVPEQGQSGILFYSVKGPGAMHAPLAVSLIAGLAIGFLAQRSRFCTMGAFREAYEHRNAARHQLVKGRIDYVAGPQGVIATIDSPSEEALEPIGGTGDTLTGLVSTLIRGGFDSDHAAVLAAQANRIAGRLAAPTPMTQVAEIIARIPQAMAQVLEKR